MDAQAPAAGFAGALTDRCCRNACSLARMPAVALSGTAALPRGLPAFLAASAARLASKLCSSRGQSSRTVLMRRALPSVVLPLASSLSLSRSLSCTIKKRCLRALLHGTMKKAYEKGVQQSNITLILGLMPEQSECMII